MSTIVTDNKTLPGGMSSRLVTKPKPVGEDNQISRQTSLPQDIAMASNTTNSPNNTCSTKSHQTNSSTTATTNQFSPVYHKQAPPNNDCANRLDTKPASQPSLGTVRKASAAGKFKEKRPEPLKLNQNPNQEIPLDLSVKSAGFATSGGMFLLTNTNYLTTLETPRIQWEDDDTLLTSSKPHLFSTSTSASQRARLPSLIGDSPPITPGTSFLDPISSPSSAATLRSLYNTPHSISFATDSPLNTFITSPFELNKFQLLRYYQVRNDARGKPRRSCSSDNLDHMSNNNNNRTPSTSAAAAAPSTTTPDSNDTDLKKWINKLKLRLEEGNNGNNSNNNSNTSNIVKNITTNNDNSIQQAKKNSISPLATKSLSSTTNANSCSTTNFPYSNTTSINNQLSASSHCDSTNLKSPKTTNNNGQQVLTPTSVANATANLLNIHLNSPPIRSSDLSPTTTTTSNLFDTAITSHQSQQSQNIYHPSSVSSLSDFLVASHKSQPDSSITDPLFSSAHCQQSSINLRSSTSTNSSSSLFGHEQNTDQRHNTISNSSYLQHQAHHNQQHPHQPPPPLPLTPHNYHQHHHQVLSSLGGSTTLNTPTMISPSQLKSGNICFLPSPTLSPMPSVFELPSPLLMFSHNNTAQQQQPSQQQQQSISTNNSRIGDNMNTSNNQDTNNNTKSDTQNAGSDNTQKPMSSPSSASIDTNSTSTSAITSCPGVDNDKVKPDQAKDTSERCASALEAAAAAAAPSSGPSGTGVLSSSPSKAAITSSRVLSDNTVRQHSNSATALGESDLLHLITPAMRKVDSMKLNNDSVTGSNYPVNHEDENLDDEDVHMDIMDNDENDNHLKTGDTASSHVDHNNNNYTDVIRSNVDQSQQYRPATVIPQIYVVESSKVNHDQQPERDSNGDNQAARPDGHLHQSISLCPLDVTSSYESYSRKNQHQTDDDQCRNQRDTLARRSLSPRSFRARCQNERTESSSAPPDVYQRRARSKIKTATPDSCTDLSSLSRHQGQSNDRQTRRDTINGSQHCFHTAINQHRTTAAPYPDVQSSASQKQSTHHQLANMDGDVSVSFFKHSESGRSVSAEPQSTCINHQARSSFHQSGSVDFANTNHNGASGNDAVSTTDFVCPLTQSHTISHSVQYLPGGNAHSDVMRPFGDETRATGVAGVGQFLFANRQQQQQQQQHPHHQLQHQQQPQQSPQARASNLSNSQSQNLPLQHQRYEQPTTQPPQKQHHQTQQQQQQQHSISTGELHRISDIRTHLQARSLFLAPAGPPQNPSEQRLHYQHQQHQQHQQQPHQPNYHQFEHYQNHHQPQHGLQVQNLRSSLNGLDNLLNHTHQNHQGHQHHAPHQQPQLPTITNNVHMRHFDQNARQQQSPCLDARHRASNGIVQRPMSGHQPFAVNLFSGLCGRDNVAVDGGGGGGGGGGNSVQSGQSAGGRAPLAGTEPLVAQPTSSPTSTAPTGTSTTTIPKAMSRTNNGSPSNKPFEVSTNNCLYAIDIESRSESMSNSSSMDFFSMAGTGGGGGGSRSSSANGSNVATKKYHCDQCSKSFTRSDMLTRHKRLHSGDRPFQCNECKQEFSRSDHLSTHMRTHTGEKPYKCKLCSYSACRKDMITRHMKVHNRSPIPMHPMESN